MDLTQFYDSILLINAYLNYYKRQLVFDYPVLYEDKMRSLISKEL